MNDLSEGKIRNMDRTPYDTSNRLLAEGPMEVTFAKVQTQGGERLAVTFRTPSTTFTALFNQVNGRAFGQKITEESGGLTSLILPSQAPATFKPGP
jgi:hypothetical protein